MLTTSEKAEIIQKFGAKEGDSGRTEVQVALLTKRINKLAPHFEENKHDYCSKRGLMKMIGQRKGLLRYLAQCDSGRYQALIKELGLRK